MTESAMNRPPRRNVAMSEAIAIVRAGALSPKTKTVALKKALGRVLVADITASRDQPPFRASAMDGYAVRRTDLTSGTFTVVGESAAGRRFAGKVGSGEAVRIFTGAPVPDDCDTVIIQENTESVSGGIGVLPDGRSAQGDNIRPAGQDFRRGDTLLSAGLRLDAWRLSLVAAAGLSEVAVARKPHIAVLCTGDELVLLGISPNTDQIYESSSHALVALINAWGGKAHYLGVEGDSKKGITEALKDAKADMVVAVGGASVGDHDVVKPALKAFGLALEFETLNLRPGKPTGFGRLADGRRVMNLPGNPASAFVVAQLLLKPWIEASLGMAERSPFAHAVLTHSVPPAGSRETYMRAVMHGCEDGDLLVTPLSDQDSSLVSVFARADALLRLPANAPALEAGTVVEVIPLDRL